MNQANPRSLILVAPSWGERYDELSPHNNNFSVGKQEDFFIAGKCRLQFI